MAPKYPTTSRGNCPVLEPVLAENACTSVVVSTKTMGYALPEMSAATPTALGVGPGFRRSTPSNDTMKIAAGRIAQIAVFGVDTVLAVLSENAVCIAAVARSTSTTSALDFGV